MAKPLGGFEVGFGADIIDDRGAVCPSDAGEYPGINRENIMGAREGVLLE
jgi:hypothetical protein